MYGYKYTHIHLRKHKNIILYVASITEHDLVSGIINGGKYSDHSTAQTHETVLQNVFAHSGICTGMK